MEQLQPQEPIASAGDEKMLQRDPGEVAKERAELVKQWVCRVEEAEKHWEPVFNDMRSDAKFAAGKQWPGQSKDDDRYRANITLRHINNRVASIYAKNPRVRAECRPRLWGRVWDGSQQTLQMAMQSMAMAANPEMAMQAMAAGMQPPMMDPAVAQQIIAEAQEIAERKKLYQGMARTLELVAQYSLDEPIPKFKTQAKQLVRRVLTCKVGYIKLGYQRVMQETPDIDAKIKDASDRLAHLEMLTADLADGELNPHSAEIEELRLNLAALQQQESIVLREGIVFSFPKAWSIIPDTNMSQLKGFVGCEWIAEKYLFTPDQVKKIYKIDVGKDYTEHTAEGDRYDKRRKGQSYCAVYEIYDLVGQVCFTVCAGYPDFLREPGEPDVKLEQFHPYYALTFNDTEDPECPFPPSDVELLRPMAMEYNRGREGLRVHRQANRPAVVAASGVLDETSLDKFACHADHEIIQTNLSKNDDIRKVLMPKPTVPIDPSLYDVEHVFVDTQRVVGDQAADFGGTSGATATEATIAANSRVSTLQSCIDDLDEFLTDVVRGMGQILLMEMSPQTAAEIAGPGAVWPELSREEVARELILEVKAGSSGRPNKQGRLAALEKTAPFLLQVPGIRPDKLADFLLRELDEGIDLDEFYDDTLPSIVAMNAQARPNLAPMAGNDAQAAMGMANAEAPGEAAAKTQNTFPGEAPQLTVQ